MDLKQSIYQPKEPFPKAQSVSRSFRRFRFAKICFQIAFVGALQYQIKTVPDLVLDPVIDFETAIVPYNVFMRLLAVRKEYESFRFALKVLWSSVVLVGLDYVYVGTFNRRLGFLL